MWDRQAADLPAFAAYQRGTERVIAVIELIAVDDGRARALGDQLRLIHADLRADLAAVRRELDGEPTAGDGAARLRRHCLAFCEAIGAHHTGEDTLGFPRLEQQVPELAPVVARLRSEHVRVAELQQRLRSAVQSGTDREATRDLVRRLADELERHFDYEEEQLVATLNSLDTSDWGVPRREG